MTKNGASANPRLRLSAWVDPVIFMNGKRKDITNPDGSVTKDVFIPDVSNGIDSLFKNDALVDVAIVDGKTIIDDISLLKTFRDDNTSKLTLGWDSEMLQGKNNDPLRKQFFQKVIDHCHHVLCTQCLLGFERKNLAPPRKGVEFALAKWFKSATPSPDADTLAAEWVKFIEDNVPLYDGLSFDLEGLTGSGSTLDVVKKNASDFYRAFAKRLSMAEVKKRNTTSAVLGFDHIVAFASGNLIGEIDGAPMKSSRLLKHATTADAAATNGTSKPGELLRDATGNFISAQPPLEAGFWEKAQDYSLGKGMPNLIIRTMSYDNFRRTDPLQLVDDWHADLVRAFLTMPDVTFQLSVKTIDGPGQKDRLPALGEKPDTLDGIHKLGMDAVMGGVGASEKQRRDHLKRRCTDLLNPNNIGLCLFPQSLSFWKDANATLNPNVPEAGSTPGMPLQAPIDNTVVALLTKGGGPGP